MYVATTRLFFALNEIDMAHYYALVVDNRKMNHKLYNEGDKEIGFNKMLFTLLYKFARIYRSRSLFEVYHDDRTTKHSPERLRLMLNARARRDLRPGYDPFRVCRFRRSHEVRCIQIADVLTGAIGAATNHLQVRLDAAPHKAALIDRVAGMADVPSLAIPTPYSAKRFDIWHIDLDARARGAPRA